jgi:hypothetical protein
MTMGHRASGRFVALALALASPALATTSPIFNEATDSQLDGSENAVSRHTMPAPETVAAPTAAPATGSVPPDASANPLWAVPLSTLAATRNRPLFSPSRRPPTPVVANTPHTLVAPPVAALPEHSNLLLVGTVAGGSDGIAVFVDSANRDTLRLHLGEGHNGWVLQTIDGRAVTLGKNDRSETLELPRPGAQAQAPTVSALPPQPRPPAVTAPAPSAAAPPPSGGCMPEPIGC